ncbi:hypothetical protein ACTXJG_09990 [Glutamicibacter arilaitensis]|uniref:hypothetical protein n=1 Tax=Glutamicibacter arilaitensis TaxID=256701 RepID=UPI003FD49498
MTARSSHYATCSGTASPSSRGEEVAPGQMVARCGNSGNSTEPHVHVQAIDRLPVHVAKAVPLLFDGQLPHNGQILQVPGTGA